MLIVVDPSEHSYAGTDPTHCADRIAGLNHTATFWSTDSHKAKQIDFCVLFCFVLQSLFARLSMAAVPPNMGSAKRHFLTPSFNVEIRSPKSLLVKRLRRDSETSYSDLGADVVSDVLHPTNLVSP